MTQVPASHHIDKRAHAIPREFEGGNGGLLTSREVAKWIGMSIYWLEIGRGKGYGPKFIRIGVRGIRYRPQDVVDYINSREHQRTSEYVKRPSEAAAQSAEQSASTAQSEA